MYGLRIGLGGTGSSSRDRKAEALTGPVLPKEAPHPLSPSSSLLTNGASSLVASSSLLSRLAAASSSSPSSFQSDDSALSHLIPVAVPSRPVPLSIADTAAEAKRQERKQKKAERRKKAEEESKDQTGQATTTDVAPTNPPVHAVDTNGSAEPSVTSNGLDAEHTSAAAQAGGKKKKLPKRSLQDGDEVTLSISDLRSLLSAHAETQLRAACKALMQSTLQSASPQSMSAKQRKELQERIVAELTSEQCAQQTLHNSPLVQLKLTSH